MKNFISFAPFDREDARLLFVSFLIMSLLFAGLNVKYAAAEAVTLTVSVQSSLSFTTSTDNFGNLTPGTYLVATTSLNVSTNNTAGWNVTLSGDDQGTSNTVCDLDTDASVGLTDQLEWIPGAATTSAGNAVVRGSLDNSGDVLAFRVMSASGSTPFRSTDWWGATDADGVALWAGIASSTAADLKIGDAGTGSYSASEHVNSVQYYLDVAATQQTGSYSCPLTYTATAN